MCIYKGAFIWGWWVGNMQREGVVDKGEGKADLIYYKLLWLMMFKPICDSGWLLSSFLTQGNWDRRCGFQIRSFSVGPIVGGQEVETWPSLRLRLQEGPCEQIWRRHSRQNPEKEQKTLGLEIELVALNFENSTFKTKRKTRERKLFEVMHVV